ncbi:hypothetical protein BGZ74_002659 [Mortierella antarctica]|nr:hypothetical protein BGZ74_002659 [Mortierella antarctica]
MSSESGSSWIQSASDKSPHAFFETMGIYVKQHGHQRYTQAILESKLDEDIKSDLLQKFERWKVNDGVQFWLDRQSQSSQMRTASTLVKGSESYAKASIHRTGKKNTVLDRTPNTVDCGRILSVLYKSFLSRTQPGVDTTNLAGKATSSRKEPDLGLDFKDDANKTICNVGIAEVTSIAQKGYKKKNAKDLVRVGEMLKNALDRLQDDFGITDAVVPGWQVIAQVMSIYIMFRCGNLYLLVYVKGVSIPDCLTDLKTLGVDIKTWLELEATITFGLHNVLK